MLNGKLYTYIEALPSVLLLHLYCEGVKQFRDSQVLLASLTIGVKFHKSTVFAVVITSLYQLCYVLYTSIGVAHSQYCMLHGILKHWEWAWGLLHSVHVIKM